MDLPMCAKCGKPVESVWRIDDPTSLSMSRGFVFEAHCHGEVERVEVAPNLIESSITPFRMEMGVAFAAPPQGRAYLLDETAPLPTAEEQRRIVEIMKGVKT